MPNLRVSHPDLQPKQHQQFERIATSAMPKNVLVWHLAMGDVLTSVTKPPVKCRKKWETPQITRKMNVKMFWFAKVR